jgi:CRISPR-associated protein Cas5 subtype I-B
MHAFYFDIESEIAHFRDPTTHAFLNSFLAPPPHTVIGMLGGLCGLNEELTEDMVERIKVGCVVLKINGFLKDLVIMENQKNKQVTKFPRTRKLLIEPKYRIYVGCEEMELISRIRESVHHPKYTPYLGISDCIAYIRTISEIREIKVSKITATSSIVNLEEGFRYTTKLKDANTLTIYPEVVESPTSYQLTKRGRVPNNSTKFLVSVNCKVSFKEPIEGYIIDGENICLL